MEIEEEQQQQLQGREKVWINASGIPEIYYEVGFSDLDELPEHLRPRYRSIAGDVESLLRHPLTLGVIGQCGTGKTRLASAAVIAFIRRGNRPGRRGIPALYVTAKKFFQHVRSAFGAAAIDTERNIISRYTSPALLVIDKIGQRSALISKTKRSAKFWMRAPTVTRQLSSSATTRSRKCARAWERGS